MKRLVASLVSLTLSYPVVVSAADLPMKALPPAPMLLWNGFYIGGHVGGYWDNQTATTTAIPAGFGPPAVDGAGLAGFGILPTNHDLKGSGVLGGLYAGYNWQFADWVFGAEADFSYLGGAKSVTQPIVATFTGAANPFGLVTVSEGAHSLGSLRGRIGYAWGSFLLYGTGGVAFSDGGNYSLSVVPGALPSNLNGYPGGKVNFNANQVGWVAGLGGEWLFANNWMFRLEYLHYGFHGSSGTLPVVADTCTAAAALGGCAFVANTSDRNIDTVRVGIAYKFGGPVVAQY